MSFSRYNRYKSSGIEWLGDVPAHWTVRRLRHAVVLNPSKSEAGHQDPSSAVSFLPMEAIGEDGAIDLSLERPLSEVGNGYSYFRNGDVALAKITPCFENGKGAVMRELRNGVGFGTTELIVARPRRGAVTADYLHLVFSSIQFRQLGEAHMYGAGGQKRVPDDFVRDFAIALPPLEEQKRITKFLALEIPRIEAVIAEQRRLMALLTEKRQAVIAHAVTKGLNPRAPMKSSGIDWLGAVPAHWDVRRIGSLFREAADDACEERPILSVSIHDGVSDREFSEEELDRKITRSDDRSKYKSVEPGDLVYNMMRAWQGGLGTVQVPGMVSPAYVVARPLRPVRTAFIEQQLRTPQAVEEMRRHSRGITDFRLRLYWDEFKTISVAIPPVEEQTAIEKRIEEVVSRNNALIAETEKAIALLAERRAALVSAAITGKIDVRGLVPA